MKEKVLEVLRELGFELEEIGENSYGFQYEGRNYLYVHTGDDEDFLNIMLPAVMEREDENDGCFYHIMDKINSTLKYVKANEFGDSMWLSYERELFGEEDLKQVISRMIIHLDGALCFLRKVTADLENDDDAEDEVTDIDADTDIDEDVA